MKIYTVIPKALGHISTWPKKIPHAFSQTTDVILLQPITQEGDSRSPYSADNYFKINKDIASSIDEIIEHGIKHKVGYGSDIVFNHINPRSSMVRKNPQWVQRNPDGSMKVAGYQDGNIWKSWNDLVLWDYSQEDVQEMALQYARTWARIPQETGGIIRLDNLHSSDYNITKKILNMLKDEFPDVHVTGEFFGNRTQRKKFTEAGVDSYLSMAIYEKYCPGMAGYLRGMHESDVAHFTPISTHDSDGVEKEFGVAQSWIPRYAVSALMNDSEYYGMSMWNEYGHPTQINFIGENIPTKPIIRMNFENYFSAIDIRAKDFTGDIQITNNKYIIHAQRNGHDVYVNFDIKKSREFEGIHLPPHSALVDNTLFYEKNGKVKEEKQVIFNL